MTKEEFSRLVPGDRLMVRYGSHGSQLAEIVRAPGGGVARVRKFRFRSKTWTTAPNLVITHADVIEGPL